MKNWIVTFVVSATLAVGTLTAHDAKLHKGKATVGEIVSVADDKIELKTATGTVPVSLTSKTKIEHGKNKVDKTHLKVGEKISVIGTKLPSGDLVAKEIIIGDAAMADHGKMSKTDSKTEPKMDPKMDHSKMGKKK